MSEARRDHDAAPPMRPASRIRGLEPYRAEEAGPRIDLALDANEGAAPSASLLDVLRSASAEDLRRYPRAGGLEARIAERWGVAAERVVVTNGGDDAIDRVCRATLEPGRALVSHTPTFEMIHRSAVIAGGQVRAVPWFDGPFPLEDFVGAISPGVALVCLVSPNNPTGAVIGAHDVLAIVRAAAGVGAVTLVDLAYVEFAESDPTSDLLRQANVVVVRTCSKALGLAGVRVGYAIAPPAIAGWLRTVGGPYPVSAVSLMLAGAGLGLDRSGYIRTVVAQREELRGLLAGLGCPALPSQANFVAAQFQDASGVRTGLRARGISVRSFPKAAGLGDLLRITLPGDDAGFARLAGALGDVLAPTRQGDSA